MKISERIKILFITPVCIILILTGISINRSDIEFWDESTNIGVMIESSTKKDWWNLKYAGEHFWEKPPLYYWGGIIIYRKFSPDILQFTVTMRAVSLVASILLVLSMYLYMMKIYGNKAALVLLIIFASIPAFWLFNPSGVFSTHNFKSVDSDIFQLLFVFWSFAFGELIIGGHVSNKIQKFLLIVAISIYSGLAVMLKGPFGLLPIIIFNSQLFISNDFSFKKKIFYLFVQITLITIVILPWHIYMYSTFGRAFIDEYLIYHQLNRATSTLEGHNKNFLFYFAFLLNPMTSGVLIYVIYGIILSYKKFYLPKELTIGVYILIFLSFLQTKISWYSLYSVPFLIIGASELIARRIPDTIPYYFRKLRKLDFQSVVSGIFVVTIFSQIIFVIISLSRSYDNYLSYPKCETFHYITDKEFHRVFYLHEIDNSAIIQDKGVGCVIFDKHELPEIRNHNKELFTRYNIDEDYSWNYGILYP